MNILEIRNLSLEMGGSRILRNISLDLWEGHTHAIVGTNGAGKTTLVHTIMGLAGYENITGDILFQGESIINRELDERARLGITLAWQEPARFEGLKVKDYILASAKEKSMATVKEVLETVGLSPKDHMYRAVDRTLSGGERKKLELASILAMKPKLAFLDEPDSGIDLESIQKIFQVVKILREEGTTVVFITHSLPVLDQADHAFLLCHGQLVDKGVTGKIRSYFENECIPCEVHDPETKEGELVNAE
jgi:Fe-S cluster assembly ATP-binding protein